MIIYVDDANAFPSFVTTSTTNAFPIKNARFASVTPSVWLSGNPFNLSNSMGVSLRSLLARLFFITCLNREGVGPPSPVTMVLEGLSSASGYVMAPSA